MDEQQVTEADFPTGLVCDRCGVPVETGQRYSEILIGFHGDIPVTELACVPCASGARG
jgi:hypothetical protein